MLDIPLVSEDDMISSRKKEKEYKEKGETRRVTFDKKKSEKPVRLLRIKYYQKISLPVQSGDGKVGQKEVFAVDRSLEYLLKALYYNTRIQGTIAPSGCIFVEKDNKMGSNNKFIFIEISRGEFDILKRQLENYITIVAFNKGEFSILDGKISSLSETYGMPRIWKGGCEEGGRQISDTNVILMRARLREELKDVLATYHSYTDEQIDVMKESELIALKKLSSRKMAIENKKRKKVKKLLR